MNKGFLMKDEKEKELQERMNKSFIVSIGLLLLLILLFLELSSF